MLRYRTRDITRVTREPCDCGRTHLRILRITGRNDDMLIIRGVNVYPSQIEAVLVGQSAIAPHYQLVVDRRGTLDHVTVEAEAQPGVAAADYDGDRSGGRPSHQVDDRHHDRRDGEAAGLDPALAGQGRARARRAAEGSVARHDASACWH